MSEIRLLVIITCLPGRGQEQADAFTRLAPLVRAEDGCLHYDLHRTDDPDRFVLLEQWASQEALAAHDTAPHMVEADAANKAFRAGPVDVIRLHAGPIA
ncbi:putative quinol monooxygenase [Streptomyces diastatochromogenes]|uniref:putative quinol monooxygenase n=1 Tax=Streptomyces diastatochromogenes TaxID=42236 RepID=UPI0036B7B441